MLNNLILKRVISMEMWYPVPVYHKIDLFYCVKLIVLSFISSRFADELDFYLEERSKNNKKYKEFWADTSNITFNNDMTQYRVYKNCVDKEK